MMVVWSCVVESAFTACVVSVAFSAVVTRVYATPKKFIISVEKSLQAIGNSKSTYKQVINAEPQDQ